MHPQLDTNHFRWNPRYRGVPHSLYAPLHPHVQLSCTYSYGLLAARRTSDHRRTPRHSLLGTPTPTPPAGTPTTPFLSLPTTRLPLLLPNMLPPGIKPQKSGAGGGAGDGPVRSGGRSVGKATHSRSYPRGVGIDFRKLAGLTLMSYIDHHGEFATPSIGGGGGGGGFGTVHASARPDRGPAGTVMSCLYFMMYFLAHSSSAHSMHVLPPPHAPSQPPPFPFPLPPFNHPPSTIHHPPQASPSAPRRRRPSSPSPSLATSSRWRWTRRPSWGAS